MNKFEYIKWCWKYIDDETPIILFYEVDLENERYAARMTEVFVNRAIIPVIEAGHDFVTEAPVPTIDEINQEDEFHAEIISKKEFDYIYNSRIYKDSIDFPE